MDHSTQVTGVVLTIVFLSGIIISLGVVWLQSRPRIKAIEVLKVYAERGEEPPASVLEAVNQIGRPVGLPPPSPPPPQTRGNHLSHVAGSVVLALGAAGIAWWRAPQAGEAPHALMIWAVIAAVFFTGAAAARLVAALHARDGH